MPVLKWLLSRIKIIKTRPGYENLKGIEHWREQPNTCSIRNFGPIDQAKSFLDKLDQREEMIPLKRLN